TTRGRSRRSSPAELFRLMPSCGPLAARRCSTKDQGRGTNAIRSDSSFVIRHSSDEAISWRRAHERKTHAMHYQITAPPTVAAEKQADELVRLLKFGKQITVQFVTVAGRYKPARARLMLMTVPDGVADQAVRVMQVLASCDDAVKIS